MSGQKHVCPWWLCFTFDNPLRRLLHNPEVLLSPYVKPGYHVIDVGAGMGYFTIPLAKMVGPSGRVTAIDLQPRMLAALTRRAQRHGVADIITPYLASPETLGQQDRAEFILAFWMAHEVPAQKWFLTEIHHLLKPQGLFLLAEPKLHVSEKDFRQTVYTAQDLGFYIKDSPAIRASHCALLACCRRAR